MKPTLRSESKLKSLITLSAGAAAVPQVTDAIIVYSGSVNEQIGSAAEASYTIDLPGSADVTIRRITNSFYGVTSNYIVDFVPGDYVRGKYAGFPVELAVTGPGPTFDTIGDGLAGTIAIGSRSTTQGGNSNYYQSSFSNQYAAIRFEDTTAGNAFRYGWVELSLTIGPGVNPLVTIHGWAYDDSGDRIAMGAIPEPSHVAAAMSALIFGGVVAWRRRKHDIAKEKTADGA